MKHNINQLRAAFFDMAHSPFVIFDKDFIFVDINDIALKTIPVTREEVIGKHFLEIFPEADLNRYEAYKEVIRTGVRRDLEEVHLSLPTGDFVFLVKAFRVGDGLGLSALNITKLITTIENQKQDKIKLKEYNLKLTEKNKELEVFSYAAAHDLKAPLINLRSLLGILKDESLIKATGEPIYSKIIQVFDIMSSKLNAVNKVIGLKSTIGDKKESISFQHLVNDIKGEVSEEIKDGNIIFEEDYSLCSEVYYNKPHLHSILHNLITNAVKYRNTSVQSKISISTSIQKNKVVLEISDNGIGVDLTSNEDKLFGLFKRMHTHVEGLGVGLYIVKFIVNAHGGHIKVKSKKNIGTNFKITL
ncbi:ATP-binding protein [Maribacter sp. LLG6340-A2]|uniref:sensor histidine kinase n=1 Tax=Maribacter sp. LLG6340-A2 TaxID=3160834 RepID=UPI00386F1B72